MMPRLGLILCVVLIGSAGRCSIYHPLVGVLPGQDEEADDSMTAMAVLLLAANAGGDSSIAATSPDSVSDLALWLKADALALADTSPVSTWTDSSGFGRDANQGVGGRQPTFATGVINGLPVVRFSPATTPDFMGIPEFMDSSSPAIFVVAKTTSTGTHQRIFNDMNSVFAEWLWFGVDGSNRFFAGVRDVDGDFVSRNEFSMDVFRILFMQVNGQSVTWSENGATSSDSNSAYNTYDWSGTFAGPRIGTTANSSTGNPVDGDVAEIIVFKRVLTDLERQGIECYLSLRYAISVSQACSGG